MREHRFPVFVDAGHCVLTACFKELSEVGFVRPDDDGGLHTEHGVYPFSSASATVVSILLCRKYWHLSR